MGFPSCFKAATIFQLKSQVSLNSTQFLAEDGREGPRATSKPGAPVSLCPGLADCQTPKCQVQSSGYMARLLGPLKAPP